MKKLFLFTFFGALSFIIPNVRADCNIEPIAREDLKVLYHSFRVDLPKPKLKINHGKLAPINEQEAKVYGLGALSPKKKHYYMGAYTRGDKIVIYSKTFQKHNTCDDHVKSELRGLLAHEYTHYLDSFGLLSKLIATTNDEQTAIVGEHAFSNLVWPNKKAILTRTLTETEREEMVKMKNFMQEYRR